MAMVITTNTASINAQRHLNNSRQDLDVAMERLSSGQRINSAADDAAGLAIRDKMTSQIEGLNQAVRNANDAISFMQSAEGALEETTNILQRMRTLAVQSVNDTNSTSDRISLNDDIVALQAEITRIGNTSTFNDKNLIDGSMSSSLFQVGHKSGQTIEVALNDMRAEALGDKDAVTTAVAAVASTAAVLESTVVDAVTGVKASVAITLTVGTDGALATEDTATITIATGVTVSVNDAADGYATVTALAAAFTAKSDDVAGYTITNAAGVITIEQDAAGASPAGFAGSIGTVQTVDGTTAAQVNYATNAAVITAGVVEVIGTAAVTATAAVAATEAVNVSGATTTIANITILSRTSAAAAISSIDQALKEVGQERAKLGAFQNRLTHAVNNMTNMSANTSSARSIIADADYAAESSSLAKNQILQQAGTAMLAQANAQAQSVLSLLK